MLTLYLQLLFLIQSCLPGHFGFLQLFSKPLLKKCNKICSDVLCKSLDRFFYFTRQIILLLLCHFSQITHLYKKFEQLPPPSFFEPPINKTRRLHAYFVDSLQIILNMTDKLAESGVSLWQRVRARPNTA